MSLIRQIWLLMMATVALAFVGSVTVSVESARSYLETQLQLKNSDNATSLALALSQQGGDPELMKLLMAAQFDTGFYCRVKLVGIDGHISFLRQANLGPVKAPAWFVGLVSIESTPGTAQVSDGWRALGHVELESHVSYAYDELWLSSIRSALALALVGVVAGVVGSVVVARIQRALNSTVGQAKALVNGEFITVHEPKIPELQRMTQAMNLMVERLRVAFQTQALQLDAMHRQANCDPLTGLSNRAHFLGQLAAGLQREDGTAEGGLVLLRVLDLGNLNRSLGHAATDRMLTTIAQALRPYADRVKGCFLGRLNGSDFAICLPVPGLARETGQALTDALRLVLPTLGPGAAICVGAIELGRNMQLAHVMAAADQALAHAEARGPFAVELGEGLPQALGTAGEAVWRQRIRDALAEKRVRLVSFPLVDARNQLVHLECPLRIQLEPDRDFESAARWLPLAMRSRLTVEVDERALELALADAARDGRPRCVNLSPASLTDSGFAARLRALLWDAPRIARLIWLEVAEIAAVDHFNLLQELSRQLRPIGVRIGLEHAGERLGQIPRLFEAGLDYVKLDPSMVRGLAQDENRLAFVRGIVTLLHGLSLQVYAEGVADADDARQLWEVGIDGATGPYISQMHGEGGAPSEGPTG